MEKLAPLNYPIHSILEKRWSPIAFSNQTISDEDLQQLFEAARWAPSCFNEQPWNFVFAIKKNIEDYENILNCLSEKNQIWAKTAPILMITVAKMEFDHNGKPNRWSWYDVGRAMSYLTFQAMSMGIYCHQMAGFSKSSTKESLNIPEGFEPVSAVALGYIDDQIILPEDLQIRNNAPRFRKKQDEFAFNGNFGK